MTIWSDSYTCYIQTYIHDCLVRLLIFLFPYNAIKRLVTRKYSVFRYLGVYLHCKKLLACYELGRIHLFVSYLLPGSAFAYLK